MLFEIFIHPDIDNKEKIEQNLKSFFQFKNYLTKHKIIIYTKYTKEDFNIKKIQKLNIKYEKIGNNITNIKHLWTNFIDNYKDINWVIHYEIQDRIIEFDFIKMIYKKTKDTFVKKNPFQIYHNLFCINVDLILKFIIANTKILDPDFIVSNSKNYYFLKYMNIISKNEKGENIYI